MSTRQQGNVREGILQAALESEGYIVYPSRGSRGIDLIAIHATDRKRPILCIGVGRRSASIRAELTKLLIGPRPTGSRCIFAKHHGGASSEKARWTFHTATGRFETLREAIDSGPS